MDDPSITVALATGTNTTSSSPISNWPPYEIYAPYQIDLNQSDGTLISYDTGIGDRNSSIYVEPGLKNNFTMVNAYTWEGGRGYRCDFWRSVGAVVPE